jgi:ABC-type transporter Mla maintaining outer membrane lipid asymmetry ATPase subunit MlaF
MVKVKANNLSTALFKVKVVLHARVLLREHYLLLIGQPSAGLFSYKGEQVQELNRELVIRLEKEVYLVHHYLNTLRSTP